MVSVEVVKNLTEFDVQDREGLPLEIYERLASDGQGMDSWLMTNSFTPFEDWVRMITCCAELRIAGIRTLALAFTLLFAVPRFEKWANLSPR